MESVAVAENAASEETTAQVRFLRFDCGETPISLAEAAAYMHVSLRSAQRLVKKGDLEAFHTPGECKTSKEACERLNARVATIRLASKKKLAPSEKAQARARTKGHVKAKDSLARSGWGKRKSNAKAS